MMSTRLRRGCTGRRRRCSAVLALRRLFTVRPTPQDLKIKLEGGSILIGIPSAKIVNAIAFFASARSVVTDAKRATSWFSMKEPRSVVSAQVDFMVLIPFTSVLMLPLVDSKAWRIQKYLFSVSIVFEKDKESGGGRS